MPQVMFRAGISCPLQTKPRTVPMPPVCPRSISHHLVWTRFCRETELWGYGVHGEPPRYSLNPHVVASIPREDVGVITVVCVFPGPEMWLWLK